jgi:hypothetical protein
MVMDSFEHFPIQARQKIRFVLADIDDTLTFKGRLPAAVFAAMERLQKSQIAVIPITGRPAGWCDHIARMWPSAMIIDKKRCIGATGNLRPNEKKIATNWIK